MKKFFKVISFFCFSVLLISVVGCAGTKKVTTAREPNTTVLVYELPYDLVFLNVMESAKLLETWNVEITDKEKGLVRFRNTNYSAFSGEDERTISVLIKRLSRSETSVQLAPYSQKVIQADKLLEVIDYSVKK